jgi:23S rRNA (uridine2552-2'-O)-methyltransferase
MLQNVSGHHDTDHLRSVELFQVVLDYCLDNLAAGGSLLGKLLRGREDKDVVAQAKTQFTEVKLVKPAASRSSSSEIYILATGKL